MRFDFCGTFCYIAGRASEPQYSVLIGAGKPPDTSRKALLHICPSAGTIQGKYRKEGANAGNTLYFSGTGNSRHAAQRMAEALGDTLLSLNDRIRRAADLAR